MITKYAVMYLEAETGFVVEFGVPDLTEAQAIGAADAIANAPWVDRAWVEKRVYDLITSQTIHTVK